MSYIMLRGRWCNIFILKVHATTEDKIDDTKGRFYKEPELLFDKFPKYHMKILLGGFNADIGREDIFKPTIGNESVEVDVRCRGHQCGMSMFTDTHVILQQMFVYHC
jgi:hypothetical protein